MIGRSDQVAAMVSKAPELFPELIAGLWSEDPLVRMRAADAAEKVTRKNRELLLPYKRELLGLMSGDRTARIALASCGHGATAPAEHQGTADRDLFVESLSGRP